MKTNNAFEDLEKIRESFGCDPAYYGLEGEFEGIEINLTKLQEIEEVMEEYLSCLSDQPNEAVINAQKNHAIDTILKILGMPKE